MEVRVSVDVENRIVLVTVEGAVRDGDLARLMEQVAGVPEIDSGFDLITDVRRSDGRALSTAELDAHRLRPLVVSPESRRAVVVGSELGYGLARMYSSKSSGKMRPIHVFRSPEAAREWIERDRLG